ncbi:transcription termination factor MTEF18, mitochondrial-like [Alnus glutinosa]|uniref:transcription termination factor MTEF18, mitochondrial-like n=1 Tax=Alnus glutinosa TaxID=3517 RepID=UPI002D7937B2|nr:transcription termination factor MTEF18, mitochondrial-like [Alnus glutinosa]
MTHLPKLRILSILKWVSSNIGENHLGSSKSRFWPTGAFHITQNPRHYRTKRAVQSEKCESLDEASSANSKIVSKFSRPRRKKGQAALLDYLHSTRSIQFLDAENMSRNSPHFLEKLLKRVENEEDSERSIARLLRYHPINEFEPFFESLGLKPSEYVPLLPRDLMFLSDDKLLLENYQLLCNYGIARNNIGKIYKEAKEVFRYDYGVLSSKLQAYEEQGLSRSTIIKFIVSSPYLLVGNVNVEFVQVLEQLKSFGMEVSWIEGHLLEGTTYNWSQMFGLLCLFRKVGCSEEQLAGLIAKNPSLLFEGSGDRTVSLIGFLLKFGFTMDQIHLMFLQFPRIQVGKFVLNLRKCFLFLNEIEMEVTEIGKIVRSHALLLGSCALKKTNSLLANLNVGKKRLCKIVQENPQELNNWVLGNRVKPLPRTGEDLIEKSKFLLNLGFVENSDQMKAAFKVFRGKGDELQERFDCIVKAGLKQKDVSEMIKVSPQVLNQKKDVIQMKIDFLVNDLGYPISSLVTFPSLLSYTCQRVNLRLSMYNWLKDQGKADPRLSLSTVVACSDDTFRKQYVNRHSRGPQVWQDLKKRFCSE